MAVRERFLGEGGKARFIQKLVRIRVVCIFYLVQSHKSCENVSLQLQYFVSNKAVLLTVLIA